MIENNILLYYTTLETAEKILRTKCIRMSLFKDSKDPFEAELPHHYSLSNISNATTSTSIYNAEDLQIVCFSKGTFPSASIPDTSEYDETKYSLTVPAMFNAYADFGEGICFLLDRHIFENVNKLEKRDIEYEKDPFSKLNEAHNVYDASNNPDAYFDMFKYKHSSFSYENELRYFKKSMKEEFVSINGSMLGICRAPRLSNSSCKKLKEISTLIALDFLILKRLVDEGIRLFFCGELTKGLERFRYGLWELFPAIEIEAQFPYRRCSTLASNNDNPWLLNLQGKSITHVNIIDRKIVSFHNNVTGKTVELTGYISTKP
jgi:hypothetical protein